MGIAAGAEHRGRSGRCRMKGDLDAFLALPEQERRDVFEEKASRLDMLSGYIERSSGSVSSSIYSSTGCRKAIPICSSRAGRPCPRPSGSFDGSPKTSISSSIVTIWDSRAATTRPWRAISRGSNGRPCSRSSALHAAAYILGDLKTELTTQMDQIAEGCRVCPDEVDPNLLVLLIEYPTL